MILPTIKGIIDRRILANYRVDPDCMAAVLPSPFRLQLVNGFVIGGICLVRLKQIRPSIVPFPWGLKSENAAHRVAVQWDEDNNTKTGVYIPRRDTSSRLNSFVGGRVFPGIHHHSTFKVTEEKDRYSIAMQSDDETARVRISDRATSEFPSDSAFQSLETASSFFEQGSLGYSSTSANNHRFDGLELQCENWNVTSLKVFEIESSFFDDVNQFPEGSVHFDCALPMRNIRHSWHSRADICCR